MIRRKISFYRLFWILSAFMGAGLCVFGLVWVLEDNSGSEVQEGLFYQSLGSYSRTPPKESLSLEGQHFVVEFGVFSSEEDAQELVRDLAEKEVTAFYTPTKTESGEILFRVRDVLFQDEGQATEKAEELRLSKNVDSKVLIF